MAIAWPTSLYSQGYDGESGDYGDGDYGDEGDADGGDWDYGDHWDRDWGGEYDGGADAPGLSSMDVLGDLGTETERNVNEFGIESYTDEGEGITAGFVDGVIQGLRDFADTFESAVDAIMDSLFVCVEVNTGTKSSTPGSAVRGGIASSVGYCVALNGNMYSTTGVSYGATPVGIQVGLTNDADKFLNGESFSIGAGWGLGATPDFKAGAVIYGAEGVSYSTGTYRGNAWEAASGAFSDAMEAGAQGLQSIERQLYNMAQDPLSSQWR
jgi:hypothetical protein